MSPGIGCPYSDGSPPDSERSICRFSSVAQFAPACFWAYALFTAQIVLCLANSTNDELLAGAPLLLGAVFLAAWFRDRALANLLFGLMALGNSVGVKLHLMFYGPGLLITSVLAIKHYLGNLQSIWTETPPCQHS